MSVAQAAPPQCSASIDGQRIRLATPFRLKELVKQLPGARWDAAARVWSVPATPSAAAAAVAALTPHGLSAEQAILDMAAQLAAAKGIKNAVEGDGQLAPPPLTQTKPWHHQVQAYHLVTTQMATLLAHDMGAGKSKVVVDAVCNLDDCRRILVTCPKSVVDAWPVQFDRHAGAPVTVVPLREGTVAQRTQRADMALSLGRARGTKTVIVINLEAAWQGAFGEWALQQDWDMVVCDEVHRIKAPAGKASRFMERVGRKARRRVGLTGTPMPHSPLDVYAQYRFLDTGIFGTSFVRFRGRYAIMGGYGQHEVLGYQHQDELNSKFYSIAHRVKKSDVLDLPPVIHEQRRVELCPEAMRIYKELEAEFIADVGSGVVTASNALARLLRLQQLTSGYAVIDPAGQPTEQPQSVRVDNSKAAELAEILDDLGDDEPIVVFCRFRHDLDRIRETTEAAGRMYMELSGRANELARWQGWSKDTSRTRPLPGREVRPQGDSQGSVLGVQIQAGGVGIDLTRAAYCMYYSLGFSLGDYVQSLGRLDRPGQTRSVTYIHLVAAGTVDEKVYAALQKRADVVEAVLAMATSVTQ